MKKRFTSFFIPSIVLIFIFNPSFSANRFWVGVGPGNWNSTTNWSNVSGGAAGFSIPAVADIAIFDGGNVTNCVIDANVNVTGISIGSLYSGTISVNAGINITTAASGFSQAGGAFIGNNGSITINSSFGLSGGVFTSTSGTLQVSSGFTNSGVFNHNNGTVSFSTTQTITGNTSLYNILFVASGGTYTVAAGTTLTSSNNVTISGGAACTINTGIVEILKDLTLTSSANNSINGGTATFLFDGTGTQNINSAIGTISVGTNERVCALPNVEVNKTSGSLNLSGVITINGTSWKTTAGAALINPGTSTVNIISSVTFTGQNLSLYNIHIWPNSQSITPSPASYVLTSTNNVIINGGGFYQLNTGVLEILGDLTLISSSTSSSNGGTGTFLFDGTGTQNINSSVASLNFICGLPNIQINKISGALNLTGIINFCGASWNTVAGAGLINAGSSIINVLKSSTLSGQDLSLYDIVVTGNFTTITINAGLTWTSTHLLTLAGAANWYQINTGTLNAKGDVLVTNTNTSNNVGGSALLLFDGSANQVLTGSGVAGGGRLPQVQINKTGGTLTLSNNIISMDNNWTYTAGAVDASTNASTVDFYKTSVIDGQGASATMAFYHAIFSGFISLGGNMDVNGDFNIRSGNNRLDVNTVSNYQLNVAGNWINNNSVAAISFNQRNGKVVFDGGAAQSLTLTLATDVETFYNLEMNNISAGLTFNAPVTVSNNLNFITGNIISSTANTLLLNNSVTATGASNASFVSGPVYKTGNQAFVFPIGKNVSYAPLSISAPAVATDQFVGEYFAADPNTLYSVSSKDPTLDHVSRCEYWTLSRSAGTSNVSVKLSWDTRSCGVTNLSDLRVARWDGVQWRDHGNGGTTGTTVAGTIVTAAAATAFGPFTLSSNTTNNPLPIDLIAFTGQCEGAHPVLIWNTAAEVGNDYFTLEQSVDAITWTIIETVKGAGTSSDHHSYSFIDVVNGGAISYYRLKQTDFDGHFKYNKIIYVKGCGDDFEVNNLTIFPNPSAGVFNFLLRGATGQVISFEVYDMLGERVFNSDVYLSSVDLSAQHNGVYFVRLNLGSKTIGKKIVVSR